MSALAKQVANYLQGKDKNGNRVAGVSGVPDIAKAYQNDPRTKVAVQAMADGTSDAPVAQGKYAYMDGIARALQAGIGGMADRQQKEQYDARTEAALAAKRGMVPIAPVDPVAIAQAQAPVAAPPAPPMAPLAPPMAPPDQMAAPTPLRPPMASKAPPAMAPQATSAIAAALGSPPPEAPPPNTYMNGPDGTNELQALRAKRAQEAVAGVFPQGGQPGGGRGPFPAGGLFDLKSKVPLLEAQGVRVNSEYRTPKHNEEVGGVGNSFHTHGDPAHPQAIDFGPKRGETVAQTAARVRTVYPGYDVIAEPKKNHVHVEPSPAMMAGTRDTHGNSVPPPPAPPIDAFGEPTPQAVPEMPQVAARPTAPQSMAAGKSPLLDAAYKLMMNGTQDTYTEAQRMYEGGLAEQNDLNEAAVMREQGIRNAGYQSDLGIHAASQGRQESAQYADRTAITNENNKREDAYVADQRSAREKALDRAARANEANIAASAKVDAAGAKGGKPLNANAVDKLVKSAASLDTIGMLKSTFKDNFVGRVAFGNTGIALNKVIGGDPALASWWQDYQLWISDIRHTLYGSAFTPNEQKQFDKIVVTPSMNGKLAPVYLQRQQDLVETALGRTSRALATEYNPDTVREAIGRDPSVLGVKAAVTTPATNGWGKAEVVK